MQGMDVDVQDVASPVAQANRFLFLAVDVDFLQTSELPDAVTEFWKAPTSGGNTGRPKIILASVPGRFDTDAPGFFLPTTSCCVIPGVLYHNALFSISSLALVGGNHVVNFPRFVPEEVLAAVTEHRPTYLYLVPTMMNRIWKLPEEVRAAADMSSLEIAVHMAAPCPAWLKEEWINWVGPDVLCELYAGTEVQSITWITGREWLEHRGSVGRPFIGQMKAVRDDGTDADVGFTSFTPMIPNLKPSAVRIAVEMLLV